MNKTVIFANPPAIAREGQQQRGMFPLPLIALAGFLDQEIRIENVSPDLLADYSSAPTVISLSDSDWLVMTCYQETMRSVVKLAKIAKNSGKKVVLGGHHITIWGGEKVLGEIPEVDYVIVGEGEVPLKLLIEGADPEEIPGLWWRENGIPKTNRLPLYFDDWPNRPPMIKGYSNFDYSALWTRNEGIGRTGYKKPISVIGIRGCAYAQRIGRRCTFCAMPLYNRLRCRNPKHFWEEIVWLVNQFEVDLIWDHSDSLLGSPVWLAEIAESRPKNTPPIWCYGRADEINSKTIELISKIGIEHVYIGVEVGSNERLKEIKKGITLSQVLNAIRLCRRYNIRVQPSFIVGLPGETEESLRDTINFAFKCKEEGADDIVFHEFILRKDLQWWEVLTTKFPELNRVVVDQGMIQKLMWQEFNPKLQREKAIERVKDVLKEFPHSELTAWNI
jgi:radical SAM superfamily enzyme YgiQ (UPF0313 family)